MYSLSIYAFSLRIPSKKDKDLVCTLHNQAHKYMHNPQLKSHNTNPLQLFEDSLLPLSFLSLTLPTALLIHRRTYIPKMQPFPYTAVPISPQNSPFHTSPYQYPQKAILFIRRRTNIPKKQPISYTAVSVFPKAVYISPLHFLPMQITEYINYVKH